MKIYIAGPMRGYELFNFPAFDEAAARGRALGHEVRSPADMDREVGFDPNKGSDFSGNDMDAAIHRDVEAILAADAIALLPGWQKSTGATAEHRIALWAGKQVLDATTFESFSSLGVAPTNAKERKALPIVTGVLDYFPDAILAVAELSRIGNDQHNPGEPLHWSRDKSTDHADCLGRHMIDRGTADVDGVLHIVKVAWRALALAQLEIEERKKFKP